MIANIFLTLKQRLFCRHKTLIKQHRISSDAKTSILYAECLECGYETPGVAIGGFNYASKT
jgi:hypothetical protein